MIRKLFIALLILALLLALGVFGANYYWTHRYDKLIVGIARKYKLDPALVKSVIYSESYFDPQARSPQKAVGLMQVTPIAAQEWVDSTQSRNLSEALATLSDDYRKPSEAKLEEVLNDPFVNMHIGCWYLQSLVNRYRSKPDSLSVALAAYNAGPANVERWANDAELSKLSRQEFIARIEFPVTRNYVQKILERYEAYKAQGGIG
jgi:soluble lytic murein transglycosylase